MDISITSHCSAEPNMLFLFFGAASFAVGFTFGNAARHTDSQRTQVRTTLFLVAAIAFSAGAWFVWAGW